MQTSFLYYKDIYIRKKNFLNNSNHFQIAADEIAADAEESLLVPCPSFDDLCLTHRKPSHRFPSNVFSKGPERKHSLVSSPREARINPID